MKGVAGPADGKEVAGGAPFVHRPKISFFGFEKIINVQTRFHVSYYVRGPGPPRPPPASLHSAKEQSGPGPRPAPRPAPEPNTPARLEPGMGEGAGRSDTGAGPRMSPIRRGRGEPRPRGRRADPPGPAGRPTPAARHRCHARPPECGPSTVALGTLIGGGSRRLRRLVSHCSTRLSRPVRPTSATPRKPSAAQRRRRTRPSGRRRGGGRGGGRRRTWPPPSPCHGSTWAVAPRRPPRGREGPRLR